LDILTMQLPINVKSPNNIIKWHMEFNSAFKGLKILICNNVLWRIDKTVVNFFHTTVRMPCPVITLFSMVELQSRKLISR
jgi:hypothetical protein